MNIKSCHLCPRHMSNLPTKYPMDFNVALAKSVMLHYTKLASIWQDEQLLLIRDILYVFVQT